MPTVGQRVKVSDLADIRGVYIYLDDFVPSVGYIGEGNIVSIDNNPSLEEMGISHDDVYCVYNPIESDDNLDFEVL